MRIELPWYVTFRRELSQRHRVDHGAHHVTVVTVVITVCCDVRHQLPETIPSKLECVLSKAPNTLHGPRGVFRLVCFIVGRHHELLNAVLDSNQILYIEINPEFKYV